MKSKILILQGPNQNLIGLKSAKTGGHITLDKINRTLRKKARALGVELKILQTNEEGIAINFLQRNRNRASGILIFPGPWQAGGFSLQDTLAILAIPYVTISSGEEVRLLRGFENIIGKELLSAGEKGLELLAGQVD